MANELIKTMTPFAPISGFGLFVVPFAALLLRYLVFAGLFYGLFYVWKKKSWHHLKIQKKFPGCNQLLTEIGFSISTIFVFTGMAVLIVQGRNGGWLQPWDSGSGFMNGMADFWLLVVVHDTWFYWTHRLMHHRSIFRYVHAIHHRSVNPSPWAAFAFHPIEAVIEAAFLPLVFALFQIQFPAFLAFMTWMILFNVMGHLGYEVFSRRWFFTRLGRWQNSGTHHNMHHQLSRCNYGLYFNFWDRMLGTNHREYENRLKHPLQTPMQKNRAIHAVLK